MPAPVSLFPQFDAVRQRVIWSIGQVALVLGLWFGLMRFPAPPTPGLDSSWQMAIAHATWNSLQFGTEVVFTYGPLGYLMTPINLGVNNWQHLAWQLGANFVFAVAIYLLGRSFTGLRKVAFYVFFFCYGSAYIDAVYMIMIVLFALSLTMEGIIRRQWLSGLVAGIIAVLALAKFTNLVLAVISLGCVAALFGWRREWRRSALIAGAFCVTFLGVWISLGQHLANLPAYLRNSFEVSTGYVNAMGLEESRGMFLVGLGAALALGAYLLLTLFRPKDRPLAIATALIASVATFLNWKHGFVRADGHVTAHFYLSLFFVVTFPVLLQDLGPCRRLKGALLSVCAACCLVGVWKNSPPWITNAVSFYNLRAMENAYTLAAAPNLNRSAQDQFASIKKTQLLPATRAVIGDKPVDMLGNEQAYIFFNDFNYRPRPVFQSYGAYTKSLARLNETFMKSPRAPEFILQRVQTIDNRLPSLDDSLVTTYLFHHYTLQIEESDFLVWKRNEPDPELDKRTLISTQTAAIGEMISTPARDLDQPIWCEIEVEPSLLGRLRTLLYKPAPARLTTVDGTDFKTSYRLVPGMAATGFLLQPYLDSNYSIAKFAAGAKPARLEKFGVELDPASRKYFASAVRVRLYELPPFPRTANINLTSPEDRFRVFSQPPTSVTALFPPEIIIEDGKEALLTHPPSELEFRVSPKVKNISGDFGLVANAYLNGHTTDGAEFIVEWIDAQGQTTRIFYRQLRPLTNPQDRGLQSFDIPAPPDGGRMLLRITPGPNSNIAYDWTYWTNLKLAE